MNEDDFSNLSDDELKALIEGKDVTAAPPGKGAQVAAERRAGYEELMRRTTPDYSQGMGGGELVLAGMGMIPARLGRGVAELAQMATLSDDPKTRAQQLQQYATAREEANRIDEELLKNPSAMAGRLVGEGIVAAGAPARLAAQVGTQGAMGFLEPPARGTKGFGSELTNRGVTGAERGIVTGAIGYPMQFLGKSIGAARGQYSPEGQRAMGLNAAAQRIGVNPTLRDLNPSSEMAGFEGQLFGRAKEVEKQLEGFNRAAREVKAIPSASGASTTDRVLEGEKLRGAVVDATQNLRTTGQKMWADLDDYIAQNKIQPVIPQQSFQKAEDILTTYTPKHPKKGYQFDANPIFSRVAYYDEEAAKNLIAMARAPKQAVQFGAPFQDLHKLQSAVGKAYARAQRDAGVPGSGEEAKQALKELKALYASMSQDVDSWMSTVATKTGNDELTKLATSARDFWRDAVIPGTSGRLPSKASKGTWRQNIRGYAEPRDFYSDLAKAQTQLDELLPYMSQEQQDLIRTFSGMPDLQKVLVSGQAHPPATGGAMLTNVGGMMLGSPLQLMKGALGHTPVVRDLAGSNVGKRMYFAENALQNSPLGHAANALAQKPRWDLQNWIQEKTSRK